MGALVVCGLMGLALAFVMGVQAWRTRGDDLVTVLRNRENLRRRNIHFAAGNLSYPHELADGRVRWYHVDHDPDAVDL